MARLYSSWDDDADAPSADSTADEPQNPQMPFKANLAKYKRQILRGKDREIELLHKRGYLYVAYRNTHISFISYEEPL